MSSKESKQSFGEKPTEVRETDHYTEEYVQSFVEKWDDLIDWEARAEAEGDFFINELKKRGCHKVLDVAAGTGFHSVQLWNAGFDVVSADGAPEMLAKAFQNGRKYGLILRTVQADWRWLNRDIDGKYDAVICLANSFTHLFSEHDRRKALAEFYSVLKHDGILFIDHRNYDQILDEGYRAANYYYVGDNVKAEPEYIDGGLARFRYEFNDKSVFHLNMFPLRRDYVRRLLYEVGFQDVTTYGDFKETYKKNEADFFIHVAEKEYHSPDDNGINTNQATGYSKEVEKARAYYNSSAADRFYFTIWGGEDIHIGLYKDENESIHDASYRTDEHMDSLIPVKLNEKSKVLDMGAGYGGAGRYLAKKYGCEVVNLNLSEVENERDRKLNKEQRLNHLIEVLDGNFEEVPYPDETFDLIWSQDSFLHSADREKIFKEIGRLLKPGGALIFTDPMQDAKADSKELQPVYDRINLPNMGSFEFYKEQAKKQGLKEVTIEDHSEQLPRHYGKVRQEIINREDELVKECGSEYIEKMKEGLKHWVENGKKGNLRWGIMVFTKPE